MMLPDSWYEAGLLVEPANYFSPESIDRRHTGGRLVVPDRLGLDGNVLVYADPFRVEGFTPDPAHGALARYREAPDLVTPPGDLLTLFTRIRSADQVLDFASTFGPLRVCDHGLPCTHTAGGQRLSRLGPEGIIRFFLTGSRGELAQLAGCAPQGAVDEAGAPTGLGREPVALWLELAGQAAAVVNLAADLHRGRAGSAKDWGTAIPRPGSAPGSVVTHADFRDLVMGSTGLAPLHQLDVLPQAQRLSVEWSALLALVNRWLELGAVKPALGLAGKGTAQQPELLLHGGGLFGTVALRLALAVVRARHFALCSGCGQRFEPVRMPTAGRRSYCDECREKGVPVRDAGRAYRARQRRERKGGRRAK